MIDFVVYSLGCKVNQVEGQSLIHVLNEHGFQASDNLVAASNYIINTCSVTEQADKKSRQMVARVLKLNGNANIFIMGCSSENDAEKFAVKDNVVLVSGSANKQDMLKKIIGYVKEKSVQSIDVRDDRVNINDNKIDVKPLPSDYESFSLPVSSRTRSYIKVQDGCNNFCSYCIVPYLRGRSRSRELDDIMQEAKEASKHSSELILTGIDISDYKIDGVKALVKLVQAFADIDVRKRLGSLECRVVTDELLIAMKEANFCDHFHLSLQSGCDSVLKRMNRHYTTDEYYEKVELIRSYFPNCGITTDVIAGFGGETEDEFNETVEFVKKVKFSDAHIFPYSERKGTKAVNLPQIDKSVRASRAAQLTQICNIYKEEFLSRQIGSVMSVYAEEMDGEFSVGHTENYIKVYSNAPVGEVSNVLIKSKYNQCLKGEK